MTDERLLVDLSGGALQSVGGLPLLQGLSVSGCVA